MADGDVLPSLTPDTVSGNINLFLVPETQPKKKQGKVNTVFPRMSTLALIFSTIDVPQHSFDTRRSFETHYIEGKRS